MFRLRPRRPPAGFIEPCLPSRADKLPSGPEWIHDRPRPGGLGISDRALRDFYLSRR
jgi:hypothetical protein